MTESPRNQDSIPGLPNITLGAWLIIGGVLIVQGITHGLATLPALAMSYFIEPTAFVFVVFAGAAWIIFHAIETLDWLRNIDQEELEEIKKAFRKKGTLKILSVVALFINVVVGIAGLIGVTIDLLTGSLLIGLLSATLYPALEVTFMESGKTPASLILIISLSVFHAMGLLTEVDSKEVLEQLAMTPMPNLDNPFLNSANN